MSVSLPARSKTLCRQQGPKYLFALLTDFADAPEKTMPQDEGLLLQAATRIKELNTVYSTAEYQPFFLSIASGSGILARRAGWLGEKTWQTGGVSMSCCARVRNHIYTQIGDLQQLSSIRYVITLDADTLLPRESGRRLVGTLAHVSTVPI